MARERLPSPNPILAVYEGNGHTRVRDRSGESSATGVGSLRYGPAPNARVNYQADPQFFSTGVWGDYNATSTVVIDDDVGGYAREISGSINDGGLIGFPAVFPNSAVTLTVGFDVKLISGQAINWDFSCIEFYTDFSGPFVADRRVFVPTADWERVVLTFNLTLSNWARWQFRRNANAGPTDPSTIRVANMTVEVGATDGSWFDVGGYCDPITGQLGTVKTAPGVSRLVPWIDEATTNYIPNPTFANNVTGWAAPADVSVTRITTRSRYGSACALVERTGPTNAHNVVHTPISGFAAGDPYTLSGWVCASGPTYVAAMVDFFGAAFAYLSTPAAVLIPLVGGWQFISFSGVAPANTQYIGPYFRAFRSAGGAATNIGDKLYVGAAQLEKKAYPTSLCHGSLGAGHHWVGAAHASVSYRDAARIDDSNLYHVPALARRGSVVARAMRPVVGTWGRVWSLGQSNVGYDHRDLTAATYSPTLEYMIVGANDGANWDSDGVLSNPRPPGTWNNIYLAWDMDTGQTRMAYGGDAIETVDADNDLVFNETATGGAAIGSDYNNSGAVYGGFVGPVAIYKRPLTQSELDTVSAAIDAGVDLWDVLAEPDDDFPPAHLRTVVLGRDPLRILTIPKSTRWRQ